MAVHRFFKRNWFGLLFLGLLVAGIVLQAWFRHQRAERLAGQWVTFNGQEYGNVGTFPVNLLLHFPSSWELGVYETGGTLNQGKDKYIVITKPDYFFAPNTSLSIYWRSKDTNWHPQQVVDWYMNEVERTISATTLAKQRNAFAPLHIGGQKIVALTQSFKNFNPGPFGSLGPHTEKRVVLFSVGTDAYAFDFVVHDATDGSLTVFQEIMDSVEVVP